MKYSIIIPTYKRPEKLIRALSSVLNQGILNMQIIIINDSPDFEYISFEMYLNNLPQDWKDKIVYKKNIENKGVNFSRNTALSLVDQDSEYVIFLDDDDWFAEGALMEVDTYISTHKNTSWLMTNRSVNTVSLTRNSIYEHTGRNIFNYFYDYLLRKRIHGDATHILRRDIAVGAQFSKKVKNGEEWFYFIQLPSFVTYANLNTTESEGYSDTGLNVGMQNTYKVNTRLLWHELKGTKMFMYMLLRVLYGIMKR